MQMDCNLNTKEAVSGSELIKVCDPESGTYRNITPDLIKKYIEDANETSGSVTGAYFQDGHLFLKIDDGSVVDVGSAQVIYDGNVVESIDGLSNISLSYENGALKIQSLVSIDDKQGDAIETGNFLKSEVVTRNGSVLIDVDTSYEQWKVEESAAILLDVVTIDSIDQCGIEYLIDFKQSEVASVSFHLHPVHEPGAHIKIKPINMAPNSKPIYVFGNYLSGEAFNYYVTHPTVFSTYNSEWRVEESSQLLSVEKSDLRAEENIKRPIHAIAFDPESPLTYQITDQGVLIVGVAPGGPVTGDYLPLTGGTITGDLKIEPQEGGRGFQIVRLDGSGLLDVNTGNQSNSIRYFKTLEEYDNETSLTEIVNRLYAYAHFLAKDRPWVKTDTSIFDGNFYHTGSEFFLNSDYFYIKTGATISTGDIAFDDESMTWTGDIVDFGVMRDDHIEFFKLKSKYFYTLATDGSEILYSNPANKTVSVKGTLTVSGGDGVKSTVFDSGQASNLLLKWNGQTRVYVGNNDVTFIKPILANGGGTFTGDVLVKSDSFSVMDSSGDNLLAEFKPDKAQVFTPFNVKGSGGVLLSINDNLIKFWSSGAIELPNYTAFKAKELITKEYADNAIQTAIDGIESDFTFQGEGLGIPYRRLASDGLSVQRKVTDHFAGNSNSGNEYLIQLEGLTGSITYIDGGSPTTPRAYRVKDNATGKSSAKTIRQYERWACYADLTGDFNTTNFEWHKIDIGTSSAFSDIDTSGFDIDEPEIKPLMKRFTNTDLITIPLTLPDGYSVIIRQVLVKRSSGVELEMDFTYRHQGDTLQVHLNEVGTGFLLAGIIKDGI